MAKSTKTARQITHALAALMKLRPGDRTFVFTQFNHAGIYCGPKR